MNGVEITLLIVGIVGGIYLLLIVTDIIFILTFRSIFEKHNAALGMMIHTKYDNIKKMVDVLNKFDVNVPFKYISILNSIDANSFSDQEKPECIQARNDMSLLRNELVFMINNDPVLVKNMELKRAKDAVTEMDANYRTLVAMYNADVLGYNYWINFLPTKYLKLIFKLKNKQMI